MIYILMHHNPYIRAGSAIGVTLLVLMATSVISWALLPQGIFRVGWGTSLGRISLIQAALRIFALNLLFGVGGIVLLNQWKDVKGLAVGYYVHLLRSGIFYGLIRGTNSFTFPYSSLSDSFRGFVLVGFWETVGLSLVCASTALLARYPTNSAGGFLGLVAFLRRPAVSMSRQEIAFLLAGVGLLGLAAVAEAVNIAQST